MPSKSFGKRIKNVKIGQKKVLIKFDDEDSLEILPNTFTEFKLFKGKILSSKDIREIKERNNVEVYYEKALKLVSKSSYSEIRLRKKLESYGASLKDIDLVIQELRKYSLLNDDEVIKEYLEYADVHNYGYNRIVDELYKKGIKKSDVDKIPYNEPNELKKAKRALPKLEKKYLKENNFSKKKKIYDNLIRLGFSFDVAKDSVELVKLNSEEHELELLRKEFGTQFMRYNYKYHGALLYEKLVNALTRKGYKYKDIEKIKGEYFNEMD